MIKTYPIVSAYANYLRVSPTKLSRIADKIRGKTYSTAIHILAEYRQKPGRKIWNLLKSVVANAEHNNNLQKEKLIVKEIFVNQGSILKRIQPRARGKAYRIEKKFSHLTIRVNMLSSGVLE